MTVNPISLVVESASALALVATLSTFITHFLAHRVSVKKTKETEEKEFNLILESDELITLGKYLDDKLGNFTIDEYCSDTNITNRVDLYLDRIQKYLGTENDIEISKKVKKPHKKIIKTKKLSNYYEKFMELLEEGEPWKALAHLRRHIERQLRNLSLKNKIGHEAKITVGRLLRILIQNEIIDKSSGEQLHYVIAVCNQGIHGIDVPVEVAKDVIYIANDILTRIDSTYA